jgi:hypothetical protein
MSALTQTGKVWAFCKLITYIQLEADTYYINQPYSIAFITLLLSTYHCTTYFETRPVYNQWKTPRWSNIVSQRILDEIITTTKKLPLKTWESVNHPLFRPSGQSNHILRLYSIPNYVCPKGAKRRYEQISYLLSSITRMLKLKNIKWNEVEKTVEIFMSLT